jgi:cell division protein FtsW (lipid II flippase)
MFVPVLFAMLWAAGARTKHLLAVVALGVASLPVLYISLPADHYARQRVQAFLPVDLRAATPVRARPPDTFQRDEAVAAVAAGGPLGHSVEGDEAPQFERVPEAWTDFVFVVHAENWGFAGVVLVLALFAGLLGGLASLAAELKEPAGRLLCVGAMVLLGSQACVNMAMTLGLFPITGVPLPLLSYGGSSMLASWLLLALVLDAKARQPVVFSVGDFD